MKDNHVAVRLEDISGKLDGVADVVSGLSDRLQRLDERLERVEQHTEQMPAVHAAIKDISRESANHATRLSTLEEAAA
jgi:archaellum component FlaC